MLKNIRWEQFGPGFMIAATAVGVSHLVQSTRAGADFGISLWWVIVLIVLLKYPAFRFATEYAASTGKSLVSAYSAMGKTAMAWLVTAMLIELLVGTTAVAMVTAGIAIEVTGLPISAPHGAILVVVLTAALLYFGRYARVEKIVKVLVISFTLLIVVSTSIAMPQLAHIPGGGIADVTWDKSTILFLVAMTGWMPLPVAVSAFQSAWVKEKMRLSGSNYSMAIATRDLNVGWVLTTILALCFLVMGTAVLWQSGRTMPGDSVGFTTTLFSVFTELAGSWTYPLFAVTGLAVIWSTLLAVMDAVPRLIAKLVEEVAADTDLKLPPTEKLQKIVLGVQVLGATIIALFLIGEFAAFIDFGSSVAFLVSPAIAYYNYRAVASLKDPAYQPDRRFVIWNFFSIGCFTIFALVYFYLRFIS